MRLSIVAVGMVACVLTGCQTTDEFEASNAVRNRSALDANIGRSVASFMERTGMTPSDRYDTDEGRVFTIEITPICRAFLVAKQAEANGRADSWIVTRTFSRGRCFLK